MGDYEVGYGKPPKHTRFKKGVCPNPKGRGKRADPNLDEIMRKVLNAPAEFEEGGRLKRRPRMALLVRRLTASALNGDVGSAASLLQLRAHAKRHGDVTSEVIYVYNSLPSPDD